MATTTISAQAIAANGFNLSDATFTTLTPGAGNGVVFAYNPANMIVLKNPTGGAAVFTLKVFQPAAYVDPELTIPDETVSLAAGKTYFYPCLAIFRNSDSQVEIECDVAGQVLVGRLTLQ